jgi:exodeoxyribonuclease III
MKIATFNANSVRARLPIIIDWLGENEPDVLAIQETKVDDANFPVADFEDAGWTVAFHGQKSYNGVALVSRTPLSNVRAGFGDPLMPEDCRVISAEFAGVAIVNTYVPNGSSVGSEKFAYKLEWLPRFRRYLAERYRPSDPVLWLGDINVAPTPDDVFDSVKHLGGVGHHPDEFAALADVVEWGLTDLFRKFTEGPGNYTFWEFVIPKAFERNLGWRIDHLYGTESLAARCESCVVDRAPRELERPSDHTFVVAEFAG